MNLIGDVNMFICGFRYYYIVYFLSSQQGLLIEKISYIIFGNISEYNLFIVYIDEKYEFVLKCVRF